MIPHYRPSFGQEEITAVTNVLQSGYLAQNGQVQYLEKLIAQRLGRQYACAVSSGTIALIIALRILDVRIDDEIIIPSYTCTALWQAVAAVGAKPVYADIEGATFNLDPTSVRYKINPKTKAIIFPHMFGQPGFIKEIIAFGIPVIEDIAQAFGATIDTEPAGHFGMITVSSFYATKIIGAGEGGVILTDSKEFYEKAHDLREYDEKNDLQLRYNAKMTDLCAAIAIEQIKKYPQFAARRNFILERYRQVSGLNFHLPLSDSTLISNNYRCLASHPQRTAAKCIAMAENLGARFRFPVYHPLHLYNTMESLPLTEHAWKTQFSIPVFPSMSEAECQQVLEILDRISKL